MIGLQHRASGFPTLYIYYSAERLSRGTSRAIVAYITDTSTAVRICIRIKIRIKTTGVTDMRKAKLPNQSETIHHEKGSASAKAIQTSQK